MNTMLCGVRNRFISAAEISMNGRNHEITMIDYPAIPHRDRCFFVGAIQFGREDDLVIEE